MIKQDPRPTAPKSFPINTTRYLYVSELKEMSHETLIHVFESALMCEAICQYQGFDPDDYYVHTCFEKAEWLDVSNQVIRFHISGCIKHNKVE